MWINVVKSLCDVKASEQESAFGHLKEVLGVEDGRLNADKAVLVLVLIGHRLLAHLVVPLLVVFRLVAALVAGVWVLFVRPLLSVSVGGGFSLRGRSPHEGSNDPGLLEDEPEVPNPQNQVNEAKRL